METAFSLSSLDYSSVYDGVSPADALWATLEAAPRLEAAGFARVWLTEHHTNAVAHSCPELLLPIIAGMTSRIRVGAAGILLRLHSPFKVASTFRLLETLFPGRIDLGLARAKPHPIIEELFAEARGAPYSAKVAELLAFLRGTGPTLVTPAGTAPPEVWILGSGSGSMELAAENGTAFSLALFMSGVRANARAIIREYCDRFRPSAELSAPKWSVAFAGVCAETDAEAERIAGQHADPSAVTVRGTPARCRQILDQMRDSFRTSDYVLYDVSRTPEDRMRSHELFALAAGLSHVPE